MFVQPALYPVDFSVLPPRPAGRKKKGKVMEMEMEMEKKQQQQQDQQHLKTHSNNNNEQCNKKISNNEKRPEKEMTIMVRILTTTTTDDEEKKEEKKTKTKKEKEKETEREWPLWTFKWFTHQRQHRHRTPPAAQAIENRRFFELARSYDIVEPLVPLLVGEKNKMKKMQRGEGVGLMLDLGRWR
ncbi:hypothetical protein SMMN14_06835, partial [Sphaerulina musiva]